MNHINQLFFVAAAAGDAAEGGGMSALFSFMPLILIVAVMYFLMIRPQKKREKEVQAMRSNLQVGDEIVTAGGIIGRVIKIEEQANTIVLESSSDRSKIRIARWAVQANNTAHDAVAETK